ncbi:serine/threonine-protein kinase [Actinomadura sp. ATCC 31491]|uniref:Serine/threonine-protein kinase n=1 Tax=Actinomadura luzonensis TaxID=2805427 RepID=A0ABT0G3B4_9ACTN|nr:serine/threonine-protein kinase [Actinomadura luzonensis]MCK2218623.1 serine/threonine-protein kinase [Actinomadura luzonensis]
MFRPLQAGEPTRLGDYRVVGGLGEGGQGVVYLGEHPSGERVAIKVLHARLAGRSEARERFLREVDAAMRVAAFCTARVLDVAVDGDRPFIVSEFVDGPSLEDSVREHGPRSGGALDRVAVSTATALAAIHRAGIVHRDFKPSNVLLGPDGPRVIDFGIARAIDMTATGGSVGTPAYMAPEVIRGEPARPASDVFSWAVTVGFAATGRPSFGRDTFPAVLYRILNAHPDLDGVPEPLRALLARCLAKAPQDRPSAAEVLHLLLGQDHSVTTPIKGTTSPGPGWTPEAGTPPVLPAARRRRSRLLVVGSAASAAVLVSVIVVALRTGAPMTTSPSVPVTSPAAGGATAGGATAGGATAGAGLPKSAAAPRPYGRRTARVALGGEVNSLAVSSYQGRRVVLAGSTAGVARAWRLDAGPSQVAELRAGGGAEAGAAVDVGEVDGRAAAFRRLQGGGVVVSGVGDAAPLGPAYAGHGAMVYAIAAAQVAGRTVLVSGDQAGKIHVWDPKTGKDSGPQPRAAGGDPVFGVATGTMDGHPFAVTASADDTAQVWDLEDGSRRATFRGHTGDVFAVAATALDGAPVAVSGGSDRVVRVWDLRSGHELASFAGHTAEIAALAVGRVKGRAVVASGAFDGTVRVWDLRDGRQLGEPLRTPGGRVYSVAVAEDGGESWLAAGDVGGDVTVWSLGPASP